MNHSEAICIFGNKIKPYKIKTVEIFTTVDFLGLLKIQIIY